MGSAPLRGPCSPVTIRGHPQKPMIRQLSTVLFALLALGSLASLPAQELTKDKFIADFNKGIELNDEKLMDKAMKRGARHAVGYYEALWFEVLRKVAGADVKCDALMASWKRCFEKTDTLEKMQRWADGATAQLYDEMQKIRTGAAKLWKDYEVVSKDLNKQDYRAVFDGYQQLAKAAESLGHYFEAAELWGLASVVGSKMPGKTIAEREEVVFVIEQGLAADQNWGYTFDEHYVRNSEFVKAERQRIEEAKKAEEKRKDEGYDPNAKGVESLVMPNVPAAKYELKFEALKDWQVELDYGPKNGPVPPFWWMVSLQKEQSNQSQLSWFRRVPIYMHRDGATRFSISLSPDDKEGEPVDVSNKGKPSTFWLDAAKQVPYAMFFWVGTDRQMVNESECNLASSVDLANVYYRSAASWEAMVGKDPMVFYDDNADGKPGDGDPFAGDFKSPMLGDATDGTPVPLFDSMRVGKGPRVPYSQFVQLSTGWHYLEIGTGTDVAVRPLNPEYVKTGKVKLNWAGPKTAAPAQLVVRGRGDYASAFFELASGKEIEVPAGEYSVVFGRIVNGKAPRVKTATLYPGPETKSFVVAAGETYKLDMGAPFTLDFKRDGDQNTSIDATTIRVLERSGCIVTEFHGSSLACHVLAGKDDSGKGAKEIGEFVAFTDPELVAQKAAHHYRNLGMLAACFPMPKGYREGALLLSAKLPAEGMKVGLFADKKHPLFGKIETVWK